MKKYKGVSAWIIEGIRFGFLDYVMDRIMADSVDEIKQNFEKLKSKTIKGTTSASASKKVKKNFGDVIKKLSQE